jgi:hypothetical protein
MEWLETLPENCGISIDDGGLTLVCDADPDAYLEVGGIPEYVDLGVLRTVLRPQAVDQGENN